MKIEAMILRRLSSFSIQIIACQNCEILSRKINLQLYFFFNRKGAIQIIKKMILDRSKKELHQDEKLISGHRHAGIIKKQKLNKNSKDWENFEKNDWNAV
jgi:hypothetical protein